MESQTKEKRRDLRLELADRLIEQIESGNAQWQRRWEPGEVQPPVNAITGKPYRGVNYQNLMLFSPDLYDNRWCTYKKANEQGWQVREGSSGIPIEVWKEYDHKLTEAEKEKMRAAGRTEIPDVEKRLGVRHYSVFHASQIDGIPPLERPDRDHELEGKPDQRIDSLAEAMGVEVRRGGSKAFYRPSADFVQMPLAEDFHTASGHDTVFLHELSHATGHESRLSREISNPFGSEKYALEELRAEMSAAMTAAALGIGFDPAAQGKEEGRETETSAVYLAGWLKALPDKDRKQILMQVIKDAQGISDYLLERAPEIDLAAPEKVKDKEAEVKAPEMDQIRSLKPALWSDGKFVPGEGAKGQLVGIFDNGQVVALQTQDRGIQYFASEQYVDGNGKNPALGMDDEALERLAEKQRDWLGKEVAVGPSFDGQIIYAPDFKKLDENVEMHTRMNVALGFGPGQAPEVEKPQQDLQALLGSLKGKEINLSNGKVVDAYQYLDQGLKRGYDIQVGHGKDGEIRWANGEKVGGLVPEALAPVLRSAQPEAGKSLGDSLRAEMAKMQSLEVSKASQKKAAALELA